MRWSDPFLAHDTLIHFSSLEGDQHKGYISSSGDGLLDDWKTGRVRPGGLDLKSIGCRVGRHDVIVEVERFDSVNFDLLKAEVDITARAFAQAHVPNPDGSRGIALHVIYPEPTPRSRVDDIRRRMFADYPPRQRRGVVHTMFCGDPRNPGFGAATIMSGVGAFTTNDVILDVMTHEFGHELGLNHDGYQPHNCPIYPSLMSYTYQDKLNGRAELKQLSSGALGSILLDERRLSERLPVPIERVRFLANEPYFYQLRPADGSTLVDWNWNGVFGEEGVVADINYSHFTDIGRRRYELGASETAPHWQPWATGQRSDCCSSPAACVAIRPALPRTPPPLPRTSALSVRVHSSSKRGRVRTATATVSGGQPRRWLRRTASSATRLRCRVAARSGSLTPRRPGFACGRWHSDVRRTRPPGSRAPVPIEQSNRADPSLSTLGDGLALFLWRRAGPAGRRAPTAPQATGLEMGPELELPIDSVVPVAAVAGPKRGLLPTVWVASIGGPDPHHPRAVIHHYASEGGGRAGFSRSGRTWSTARSPGALWPSSGAPEHGLEAGRIYVFAGGRYWVENRIEAVATPWAEQTVSINVRNGPRNGWLHRRYYSPGEFDSRSAPGVCWFRDDIAYANRRHSSRPDQNDRLLLGFTATGAFDTMTDFNDFAFIAEIGLSHSLMTVSE